MKPNFERIINESNNHSTLLDKKGLVSGMEKCYYQGVFDGQQELIEWLSKMDYLSDNINYILEEWENFKK